MKNLDIEKFIPAILLLAFYLMLYLFFFKTIDLKKDSSIKTKETNIEITDSIKNKIK